MNNPIEEAEKKILQALTNKSTELDLSQLDLQSLPDSIWQLSQLQVLHLSNTSLQRLPDTIGQLSQLQVLLLVGTPLQQIPDSIGQLCQLQALHLSHTQLQQLPEAIGQLRELRTLSLYNTPLQKLPDSIGQLTHLQTLDLSNSLLEQLPEAIGQLTEIQNLFLSDTQLQELPTTIGQLKELRALSLSHTHLKQLPEAIGQLTELRTLSLYNTPLQQLPDSIGLLTNLQTLDLSNSLLKQLPEAIGQLTELENLYLSNTQLQQLPASLQKLKNLKQLYLHSKQSLNIPIEILGATRKEVREKNAQAANPATILDYYFRVQTAQLPLNEAKLIFVGRGGVGKSSLVKKLLFNRFDEHEKKTEGIAISKWKIHLHESEEIHLNLWDFGGQEIMHATHQFFMTQRSLYLLVLEGRQGGEDADAEYWLKLIESFGTEDDGTIAPVIVVLNKSSLNPFDLNRRALTRKFPFIREFILCDCNTGYGIHELRTSIEKEIDHLPYLRAAFPSSWFTIKDELAAMQDNFISFEQYRALCKKAGEKDCKSQDFLATHMHNLGVALNYKDDPRLRDTHVLNPRWVTSGVYALLNDPLLQQRNGELKLDDVGCILDPVRYPRHMHRFLLDLMRKFELCFTFTDDDTHYLIPELLDKQEPKDASNFDPFECLNFEYRYSVLPEGLLPRFIVRTHSLSEGNPRWRTGVILSFDGNRALVRADAEEKRVCIAVDGPLTSRQRLLAVIRSDFERIHASISKLRPEEVVPIPGIPDVSVPYAELITFEKNGLTNYPKAYNGNILNLDVQQLLNGVDLAGTREQNEHKPDKPRVKIFYSYAHKDEYFRNKLETHLKILERTGVIDQWHDRNIEAGDDWKKAIDENLERADIILLLISADFIASEYCWEKEMMRALERDKSGDANVIPIIIRDVNWKSAPFAGLNALPKDGKAVKLWENEDSAWRNVSEGIELVVKNFLNSISKNFNG